MTGTKHNPLQGENPAPILPPRPLYFEPEHERKLGPCPACEKGGVCSCILHTPEVT